MSNKIRVVLNRKGVRDMLKSQEMRAICIELANGALQRLGDGYSVNSKVGKNRVNAEVVALTEQARQDNSKNNSILKALR